MSRRLLISELPGELRAALVGDDGRLEELVLRRADRPRLCDGLFLGRVQSIDRGLEAAFVDLGLKAPGFLPFKHCPHGKPQEGICLAVRVVSEPPPGKGPKLTARLSPQETLLVEEHRGAAPQLLRRGEDGLDRMLAEPWGLDEIVVDRAETLRTLRGRVSETAAGLLRHDPNPHPLFEGAGVEAEIEALLSPVVALEGRAVVRVEPVSTLVALDVDSAGSDYRGGEAASLAIDLAAAHEIPRQLWLRGLGGLVVIDFLELPTKAARQQVQHRLLAGFRDEQSVQVRPMSPTGLVELSLRRLGPSLLEILCEPIGIGGMGRRKNAVTLAYEALRGLRGAMADAPAGRPALRASARIVHALEGPLSAAREEIEMAIGRAIELQPSAGTEAEDYEIVLG